MILIDPSPRTGGCEATEPERPDAPRTHRHACVGQGHSGVEHLCGCGDWFVVPGVGA